MVYCTSCGTEFDGNFCPKCGHLAAAAAPPPPGGGYTSPPFPATSGGNTLPSNYAAILCYAVPIIGPIVFLALPPYNQDSFVRFNARQALYLQLAYIVLRIVLGIVPLGSWHVNSILGGLAGWLYLGLLIFLGVKCYQSEKVVLPVVGPQADRPR